MKRNANFVTHRPTEAVAQTVQRRSTITEVVQTNAVGVALRPRAVVVRIAHLNIMKNKISSISLKKDF